MCRIRGEVLTPISAKLFGRYLVGDNGGNEPAPADAFTDKDVFNMKIVVDLPEPTTPVKSFLIYIGASQLFTKVFSTAKGL